MTRKLSASPVARGKFAPRNIVVCGDAVSWSFANPPNSADAVEVKFLQDVRNLDNRPIGHGIRFAGGFLGKIRGKQFQVDELFGSPSPKDDPNPAVFRIIHPDGLNEGNIFAHTPDPVRVSSHVLKIRTEHDVAGERVTFKGKHELEVRQSLAMVVPSGRAFHDTTLNHIRPYANHWKQLQPDFRHIVATPMVRTATLGTPRPEHFNKTIEALVTATEMCATKIVALATGHGSHGGRSSFINFVPEDKKGILSQLHIQRIELERAATGYMVNGIKHVPSKPEATRVNALDRLGEALREAGARRLIFHTCRAGSDSAFMQLIADRLQIPVAGQKDWIWFSTNYSIYDSELTATEKLPGNRSTPKRLTPKHRTHWLVHKLSRVFQPGRKPPPVAAP